MSRSSAANTARATPVLVVVPCARSKIWHNEADRGSVAAAEAYTGSPFRRNRQYAEHFGDAWNVLSTKYGVIASDFIIRDPYLGRFAWRHERQRGFAHVTGWENGR
jgi:hypothetical protein